MADGSAGPGSTIGNRMKTPRSYVPAPSHQCPPVDPKDLPTLRECLQQADPRLRTLAVVVASTGKRADEVRQMRRQDVRLNDRVWLYRQAGGSAW